MISHVAIRLLVAVTLFFGGFGSAWSWRGALESAHQKAALEAQIEADRMVQAEITATAKQTEGKLAAERQKLATLNRKWSAYRAQIHTDCKLPAGAAELLKDATGAEPELPR